MTRHHKQECNLNSKSWINLLQTFLAILLFFNIGLSQLFVGTYINICCLHIFLMTRGAPLFRPCAVFGHPTKIKITIIIFITVRWPFVQNAVLAERARPLGAVPFPMLPALRPMFRQPFAVP
uniref:Putative secreted protein n=1 Tax=Ixodes ricinus TaxID=34613 RepID=A0A6B0UP77_IXORI